MKLLKRVWNWIRGRRQVPAARPVQRNFFEQKETKGTECRQRHHHSRGKTEHRGQRE